ncbi:MAG: peptide chain release factor N(5)-glutamine methyltransferase [Gammaproteobacteria bacterium]|nr:MAG: peptide chain release factor N(5)-glutamine methyltransferase [Gammaproteobacteria bacterium]RKZ42970.1 MAG: peptide chain release factor N(5)-glutamine methyltransferase [Gammaproteobacteria bacterium]
MKPIIHTTLIEAIKLLIHSDSPRLDAEVLLSHVLGVTRSYLYAWSDKILTPSQNAQFQTLLTRRLQDEPIAYLTGHKEFWSLHLRVTQDTLIPRPDTELLVEQALARLPQDSQEQVIDLGTGSGAIALAIAQERPHCRILATDKSRMALKVAQANAKNLALSQVTFMVSNWWIALGEIKATLIVSNPPYIPKNDPHLIQGGVQYEPRIALIAGADGLVDIRQLIAGAISHLVMGGWLLLEHGYDQAKTVRELFIEYDYESVKTYHDLAGLPRITVGQKHCP